VTQKNLTGRDEARDARISLRDLAVPLFRRKKLLVITFLITFAVMVLPGLVLPASYKSQMSILVNRERLDSPVTTEATTEMITTGNPVTEEEINSEAELLKSRDVLEKVVLANGLAFKPSWLDFLHPNQSKEDRVARAVKGLARKLKIEVTLKTDVINVSYSSSNPSLSIYRSIDAPLIRTDLETAKMIKYVDNAWHALKIGFANEIGSLCKSLGIDSHAVMGIFCQDKKLNISPAYLRPGFAFGGSCLPKDLRALNYCAKTQDLSLPILSSILPSNNLQIERGFDTITKAGHKRVGILGFSFKEERMTCERVRWSRSSSVSSEKATIFAYTIRM
jgi:UDP-glucose/GDP-mannose dehydrogenase family, central domain/Chain length determinant protein